MYVVYMHALMFFSPNESYMILDSESTVYIMYPKLVPNLIQIFVQ